MVSKHGYHRTFFLFALVVWYNRHLHHFNVSFRKDKNGENHE